MAQAKRKPKTKGGAEPKSTASEARLRAIVDNVLDGLITIDQGDIVQFFNPAAERMFGYTAGEVVGQSFQIT
jgi:PAS domain S-box-containing protein